MVAARAGVGILAVGTGNASEKIGKGQKGYRRTCATRIVNWKCAGMGRIAIFGLFRL